MHSQSFDWNNDETDLHDDDDDGLSSLKTVQLGYCQSKQFFCGTDCVQHYAIRCCV